MSAETITIGKALLERSAITAKITDISNRITNNSLAFINLKGERHPTNENIEVLMNELRILEDRHLLISNAIINANYTCIIRHGDKEYRIIEVVEMIERYKKNIKRIKDLIAHIEGSVNKITSRSRYGCESTEGAYISTIDVSSLRKILEKESHVKNTLQVLLQQANWSCPVNY